MSRLFSGTSIPPHCHFKIRVNDNHLILRGSRDEAPRVLLNGTVALCLTESLKAQAVRITFTGKVRGGYISFTKKVCKHEERFLSETKTLFPTAPKQSTVLGVGNHEWPFEFVIDGNKPESLEGLPHSWLTYDLKAVVERGLLTKDLLDREHVRLIRTVDSTSLEHSHTMVVDNLWPNKIKYRFSTPSKCVMYGSAVSCKFEMVPLLKGLKIGKIHTQLLEERWTWLPIRTDIYCPQEWHDDPELICEDVYELPEGTETENIEGYEGYRFSRTLALPRNLQVCRQSFEHPKVKIEHQLKFVVALHNPAGHTSELRCKLPITLAMPTIARMNNENEMVSGLSGAAVNENLPPPGYGDHLYDQIYSDIDLQYLMTPSASAPATPKDISRSGSAGNLAAMDGNSDRQVSANTLRNRLSGLTTADGRDRKGSEHNNAGPSGQGSAGAPSRAFQPGSDESSYFASGNRNSSNQHSPGPSASTSAIQGSNPSQRTPPIHLEYNNDELNKVPSYSTALSTSIRTPWNPDLPSYQTATSRPASPENMGSVAANAPALPAPNPPEAESSGSRPTTSSRRVHYAPDTQGSDS